MRYARRDIIIERVERKMNGQERRNCIVQILSASDAPVSGKSLSQQLKVSRQIIVQDIALLRANGTQIISTNYGYVLQERYNASRVFKIIHSDSEVEEELSMIVDFGGKVQDVFVYHKVYGVLRADMNIRSRLDIHNFMKDISLGKSSLLKNITSGYHYHTVLAEDEQTLDLIQEKLQERGFLAKLQDYEPVDFWSKEKQSKA